MVKQIGGIAGFAGVQRAAFARLGLIVLLLACLLAALAGCAERGGPVPYNVENFGKPDQPKAADSAADYRISAQDTLHISVFNVPEFSGDFTVDTLGRLRMPLIGEVMAQGKTTDEIDQEVTAKLSASYLRDPNVQVSVKEAAGRRITVDGSVGQPGVYPIAGETTLMQSIAMARGLSSDANSRRVVVFRMVGGERMAAAFDVRAIRRGEAPDPTIYQNDIIVVDGSRSRKFFQDVLPTIPLIGLFARF